jgi:hypothetical protein
MPKVMSLYLDDSGTRNPDRHVPDEVAYRDWFTLGGYVTLEADEGKIRTAYDKFCESWKIKYPLRSYDIRMYARRFSWLAKTESREVNRFMQELSGMLIEIPVVGHACVIDRPGYNNRYREKYGRQTWQLCQTAFSVVCERAAKHARKHGCKLRIYVEEGDKTVDDYVRRYYAELRKSGMPFASDTSARYAPLSKQELSETLYDLDFKAKSSPMMQIADLYVYPVARGGYDAAYAPYALLREHKKLIDDHLTAEEIPHLGIKYYCFDLVKPPKNKKSRK